MASPLRGLQTRLINVGQDVLLLDGIAVLKPGGRYHPVGVLVNRQAFEAQKPDEHFVMDGEVVFDVMTHHMSTAMQYSRESTTFDLADVLLPAYAVGQRGRPHAIVCLPNGDGLYLSIKEKAPRQWVATGTMKSHANAAFTVQLEAIRETYTQGKDPSQYPALFAAAVGCPFPEFVGLSNFLKRTQDDKEEAAIFARFDLEATAECPTPFPGAATHRFRLGRAEGPPVKRPRALETAVPAEDDMPPTVADTEDDADAEADEDEDEALLSD